MFKEIPKDLPLYHPESELGKRSGYYPNIDENQLIAVNSLCEMISAAGLTCEDDKEIYFLKLLRFLRARNFNVQKAFDMIKADVEWRQSSDVFNLVNQTSSEVLDCDSRLLVKYFPAWMQGSDKQLRPIAWRKFGFFEIWNILKFTTMERIIRFHAWEAEQVFRVMREQSISSGYNIETFVLVVDAAHWHLGLFSMDALTFIKGMVTTDADHNPERLGKMIVINAPIMLSVAWKVIQTLLDDVSKAKMKIISHKRDWFPELLAVMDISQIPRQYGGEAPDPDPEDAYRSMEPPVFFQPAKSTAETATTSSSSTGIDNSTSLSAENITAQVDVTEVSAGQDESETRAQEGTLKS